MNLDEIVFFRHKEVIVYPEEEGENKPELGEGLNKKAQITLDKVSKITCDIAINTQFKMKSCSNLNMKIGVSKLLN